MEVKRKINPTLQCIGRDGIYNKYLKRFVDIILSSVAIIVLSPVLLLVAFLVKINLGNPIIFKQKRPGLNEKIFTMYKFRTMKEERDEKGELLPNYMRFTKFGRVLRSTSLDELPELFNVLNGDMSLVGPRPLLVEYLSFYNEHQKHRHDVRPGITGLAQTNGRNAISWEEKLAYDIDYVENITLLLDLKIIIRTFFKVLTRDGVNRSEFVTMEKFRRTK